MIKNKSIASCPLRTTDNNIGKQLNLNKSQKKDLLRIAGKSLESLGEDILIFPESYDVYGDKFGKEVAFRIDGDKLLTGNIMGFIGRGDTMIKIGSRFDEGEGDYFMHYMLEKVLSINLFDLNHSTSKEEIFDFLPFLFPYYLKKALAQGIYKEYQTYNRNDSAFRGVLDVTRHIRLNYPATGNVAYKTREHTIDNSITELIRHTIECILRKDLCSSILSNDEDTKTYVRQIVGATPNYNPQDRQKVINANLRPKIHPYYSEYANLCRLCLQILKNEEMKYGSDDDEIYGILFDGAWLWEEYLNTILEPMGIKHPKNKEQKGGFPLFENGKAMRYPDFYNDDIVLDAKYKSYYDKDVEDVSREDLAQIISYMYVQKAPVGIFLSPSPDETVRKPEPDKLRGYGGNVALMTLGIPNESNYDSFVKSINQNEKSLCKLIKESLPV